MVDTRDHTEDQVIATPSAIVTAILALFCGAGSLAYDPFFATSVIAIGLSLLTLRSASRLGRNAVRGILRVFAVVGIIAGVGGAVAVVLPSFGFAA